MTIEKSRTNHKEQERREGGLWVNLSIRVKFLILYVLLISISISIAVYGVRKMGEMRDNLNDIIDVSSTKILLANQIIQDMLIIHREEKNMILAKSTDEIEGYDSRIKEQITLLVGRYAQLSAMADGTDKIMLSQFKERLDRWIAVNERVRQLKIAREDGHSRVVSGTEGRNQFKEVESIIKQFVAENQKDMRFKRDQNKQMFEQAFNTIFWITFPGLSLGAVLGILVIIDISNTLRKAVGSLSKGSGELEKAANDQLSGAVALASTTEDISNTIKDILVSARDISKSAQDLTEITDRTSRECQKGSVTLNKSQQGVEKIKDKVQLIARHMLDLGQKLQHISGVLSIINELSEQTNLLSLNATIEAAGAGEAGRRFAVVADEIRKLAERAVESTQEIRVMIDDIQQTSTTAIMVTEDGTKTVDEGLLLYQDVLKNFQEIIKLVEMRTDKIKEIDKATGQQSTSIDQLNKNIQNVAKTAKRAEASSNKTFKTVLQLLDITSDIEQIIGRKR